MNVSAVIVTRGDVDLRPVLDSLPEEWERVVWDNGAGRVYRHPKGGWHAETLVERFPDRAVYGRYEAIKYAHHELIYVQDDDVIVSDPTWLTQEWEEVALELGEIDRAVTDGHIVCNMPAEFASQDFYSHHALVGFGAAFHHSLPERVFAAFDKADRDDCHEADWEPEPLEESPLFQRTCDIVLTHGAHRVLVDVPKVNLEYASAPNRMWKQPEHVSERQRMLALCRGNA